ncbi:PREDICTED: UDP-glycosyltransferase 85A2-like [Camelina sativa]|uniref:UDP-glycosyltransferase 85A2-like n=1 Tax=Camelina sativa TaxID=90675 RepID=A0ABM1QX95_CAMSA|nr:PREDICTED: UDP-glycosyltransferase 85A2-like [Camelina sativa]
MLQVAKLLHTKGFHVTFVNTIYNHKRLLRSRGPNALNGIPSFRFEYIPDGLPETNKDATQDVPPLCASTKKNCLAPFKELLRRINTADDVPPVSSIVSDGIMSFTLDAAEELGVPDVVFWTTSACGFLAYLHFYRFIEKGLSPLKDESYLTKEHLDTKIDWIPSMGNLRLKDIPSFIRTTNPDDIMLNFFCS